MFDPSPVLFLRLLNVLHPKKQGFALKTHSPCNSYLFVSGTFPRSDLYDGTEMQGPSLALYETTRERDLDMTADLLNPAPTSDSKGNRLLVR